MLRSLKTAALGMSAQQLNVDNIANNLANVNTTGFKKSSVEFQDLLYENIESGDASKKDGICLLYTSPSPRDGLLSRMPSSA